MSKKTQLRSALIVCLLTITIVFLSAAGPLAAETNGYSLTTQVDPPGSGTVNVNPGPPYSQNQTVTLTAVPSEGYAFDRWVLGSETGWWNDGWDYRVEVTAAAAGFARKNKPAEFDLNFTQLWNSLGVSGTLDPNSIRVVEVNNNGDVIDADVAFQFDRATDYNATSKAAGTLVLIMKGNTAAGASRRYHVYFDVTGKGFAPPNVPAQVTLTDGVYDIDQMSFKVQIQNGTLYLHKLGAGFSSFNDENGNDWISYSSDVGAAGKFRGIPNAVAPANGGYFHPGNKGMNTTLRNQGPIKVTIHAIESKAPGRSKWEGLFEIYPGYVVFTMITAPYDYWVLYEGTPGGVFQGTLDFVVRSDGTQNLANQSWEADLVDEEWVYIADSGLGRALFYANHIDDTKIDSYAPAEGVMTKLGFGRKAAMSLLDKTVVPREFTFGLMDETVYENAKPIVYNAYKPLEVSVGAVKARSGSSLGKKNPVQFTITGDHSITAVFKPAQYTVTTTVSPNGTGTVTKTPDKATYNHGEQVTLTAAATAPGYNFVGWEGDVNGTENPIVVTVTKNMNISAVFAQAFTITTQANPPDGGTITLAPPGPYAPGTPVTVTAIPNTGYTFTNWGDDANDTENPKVVTVNNNLTIVANFGEPQYTFNATANGNGSVDWSPKKDFYVAGEQVTVTATPGEGSTFSGWTGSIVSSINPLDVVINGNISLVANFTGAQTYTVNVTVPGGGGTVTKNPPGPNYPAGASVTLTATPNSGKRFVAWGGDTSGTNPVKVVTVTGNMNITAEFADNGYPLNVTLSPPEGGVVFRNPDSPLYQVGTVITLTAVTNAGWTFDGWIGDVTEVTPNTATVEIVEGGNNVTALFSSPGPFTLKIGPNLGNGSGAVSVDPNKTVYQFGEIVTLTATPDGGSVFSGWSGSVTSKKNPLTVTMDGNKTISATFAKVSGNPQSDNFNVCNLDPRWEKIDPLGGGSFKMNLRQLQITVPEGDTHNVWSTNDAPRVMQAADNIDFEYVVKFDSQVTQIYQMQGLIVEESAKRFIRLDFEYNNGAVKAYASTTYDASPPKKRISKDIDPAQAVYMRVTRKGTTWSMDYSGNGIDWANAGSFKSFELVVAKVGIFAGNVRPKEGVPAPAHTVIVDFFQNVAQGPIGEDRPLLTINTEGNGTVTTNPPFSQLACNQTVNLTAKPGGGAQFIGWSGDITGTQTAMSLLLNGPKSVTASFTGTKESRLFLPMITQ